MTRVVVVGGYGAVGREVVAALAGDYEVVAAGRDLAKARSVENAIPMRLDITDTADIDRALDGADVVVTCVEGLRLASNCAERGVPYVDVTATYEVISEIEKIEAPKSPVVLSVGLAPGVTNLLARYCATKSADGDIRIGVLLGGGEKHGGAAVDWTLAGLTALGRAGKITFPPPFGERTVYGFPFSDQYTLRRTLGVARIATGMCLDSRAMTAMLAAARPVARFLNVRPVRAALTTFHLGGDDFAVQVERGDARASFTGSRQSRATGRVAAQVVRKIATFPPGVRHLDELVDPEDFLTELAAEGFTFRR